MIKENAQAEILDVKGVNPIILDINFDEENKDCVKITLARQESIVKYSDLFSFMFTIATKEQQAKMIPVREELGTQYMKQIHVKLKKAMKEGEEMVVNVPINVPQIIEEQIKFELEKQTLSPYLQQGSDGI